MIGLIVSIVFTIFVIFFSTFFKKDISALVKFHLAVLPQTPLVLFFNHNLDGVSEEAYVWYLMLPVFASLFILSLSLMSYMISQRVSFTRLLIDSPVAVCFCAYIFFSVISAAGGTNPGWSYYAMLWTMPFGIIFLCAGHLQLFSTEKPFLSLSVIFSCFFAFAIVLFAMVTGRAHSVFETRSFGSILSTTGILQMIALYFPVASLEQRKIKIVNICFWVAPPILLAVSLSRSAVLPLVLYIVTAIYHLRSYKGILRVSFKTVFKVFLYASPFLIYFMSRLMGVWAERFKYLPYAIQSRMEYFGSYWGAPLKGNPFFGVGFGLTKVNHPLGYSDLHNMLLTELYENGFGAGIFIFIILILSLWYSGKVIRDKATLLYGSSVIGIILLAHLQGCNLALRFPGGYNTPYFMCAFFFLIGLTERKYFLFRAEKK
ncbi:MAG: hypothetical protein ACXVCN_13005 [Bdellovibrio sp.]